MKLLAASQIKEADAFTITHEPISSTYLMERAAGVFTDKLLELFDVYQKPIAIVAGIGNNGGDGLVIAQILQHLRALPKVFIVGNMERASKGFLINFEKVKALSIPIIEVKEKNDLQAIDDCEIIVDAIFGIGLSRPAEGLQKEAIMQINQSGKTTVSVDVPSGLFCDSPNSSEDIAIYATHTITFQQVKFSFLFPENGKYCGKLHTVDIGLSEEFYKQVQCNNFLIEKQDVAPLKIFHRKRFSHKGTYGHLLLVAGSYGKSGAAALSAKSALKSGAGLVSIHSAAANIPILQMLVPEAMCIADELPNFISKFDADFASAFAVGPGIGTHEKTAIALIEFLQQNTKPLVLDADALNILAKQKSIKNLFPAECVITPHPKEFDRLAGSSSNSFQRFEKAKEFARTYQIVVVLKGAYTAVIQPSGKVYFNATGNAGMATAGSGDVLTGIIGAFLSQGLSAFEAALAGVYLHGLAGDFAAKNNTELCVMASDIIEYLPLAVREMITFDEKNT